MICETCGATLTEASREVVTEEESRLSSAGFVAQARASLAAGGSPAERQVWQMVADTGVDTAGTWAVMECPTGCAAVIVRVPDAE